MKSKTGRPATMLEEVIFCADEIVPRQFGEPATSFRIELSTLVILDYFTLLYESVHVPLPRHPEGSG